MFLSPRILLVLNPLPDLKLGAKGIEERSFWELERCYSKVWGVSE